nr:hypothetical protein [Polynucleobacter necessarius]
MRLIFLKRDEIAGNFEGGHHAGALNASVATTNGQLNLFVN